VTPFGLANALSTFQQFINWVLQEEVDDFCSAHIDNVLIYSNSSQKDHEDKVKGIIRKLGAAELHLDVDKSEFSVKKTKYLGFIIKAEQGISMDPEKVSAITAWKTSKMVKGIRSFIGFANFYRQIIRDFSGVVAPLTKLTGNGASFAWKEDQ
jgi:hypothetical protein